VKRGTPAPHSAHLLCPARVREREEREGCPRSSGERSSSSSSSSSSSDGPTAAGHRTRYAVCRFGRSFVEFLSAALKMSVRSPRTRFDTSSLLHNRLVGR